MRKKMLKNIIRIDNIARILLLLFGICCIIFSNHILHLMPYLIGGIMIVIGAVRGVYSYITGEYKSLTTEDGASAIIMIVIGIGTIVKDTEALTFIGITWGLLGLFKGAKALNKMIYDIVHKKRFIGSMIKTIIFIALSCALIFHHTEKIQLHILILGVELIFYAIFTVNMGDFNQTKQKIFARVIRKPSVTSKAKSIQDQTDE